MFKLVFLVAVLVLVVVSASPHPRSRQAHSKKLDVQLKHPAHHGIESHKRSPVRAVRSHNMHKAVHHSPGVSGHLSNKAGVGHAPHKLHSNGNHNGKKRAAHHPVKRQGHHK